jgi:hypothetical protein
MILEFDAQFQPIGPGFVHDTLIGKCTCLNRLAEALVENILAEQRQFQILIQAEQIAKPSIKGCAARQKSICGVMKTGELTAGLFEAYLSAQFIVADIKRLLY